MHGMNSKKAYEGRTATEFHALLESLYMHYNDRKITISDHIAAYEKTWNIFAGIIGISDLSKDKGLPLVLLIM